MSRENMLRSIVGEFQSTPDDDLPLPYKQTNSPLLLKPKGQPPGGPGEVIPPIPEQPEPPPP